MKTFIRHIGRRQYNTGIPTVSQQLDAKGQDYTISKIDLKACRRHHSRPVWVECSLSGSFTMPMGFARVVRSLAAKVAYTSFSCSNIYFDYSNQNDLNKTFIKRCARRSKSRPIVEARY